MDRNTLIYKINVAIRETMKLAADVVIQPTDELQPNLGIDDFDLALILMLLEERLPIPEDDVSDDEFEAIEVVNDIYALMERKLEQVKV